jgi:small subunit ribosomal protein S5
LYVGGSSGKGGGIQRRAIRRTVRIHKSGKRMNLSAMIVIGNREGYFGIGFGRAKSNKEALKKAALEARKNIFHVKRGCGSWECKCGTKHSIPLEITGKAGSVVVKLMPAPKGLGLCVSDEIKKIFELIGIQDIRIKTRGQTGTRINFVYAVEDALRNLNRYKI